MMRYLPNLVMVFAVSLLVMGKASATGLDEPSSSVGDIRFFVDLAAFRGPEGYARQEVSVLLDVRQFQHVKQGSGDMAKIVIAVALVDSLGQRVADKTWVRTVAITGLEDPGNLGAPFRDVARFDLRPGMFRMFVVVKDVYGKKEGTCEVVCTVRDFEQKGLVFSDLQLASAVMRSGKVGRFVKQGWQVVPNVTRNYLSGKPVSVYFELYNLVAEKTDAEESFILGYHLADASGEIVRRYPAKRFLKPGESCVKAEVLETENLSEGVYLLVVEAYDGASRQYRQANRPFFLMSKELPDGLTQLQKDLLYYYADIRYIADSATLAAYQVLQDWPTKLAFLNQFWNRQKEISPGEERLLSHLLRMHYVDRNFSVGRQRGSDMDKGRVYIQYGPPADILYQTSAAGQRPFELWVYEIQRRYEFVFRDRRGVGVYELVHSTHPGEPSNPFWQQAY
ncbi:MAG: GWxTD domain-containing protein [Candidatus Latescibacterota bacterium]|jgi:GWxTD domain-containing protein